MPGICPFPLNKIEITNKKGLTLIKIKSIFTIRTVFLILALIPVLALVLITINLVMGSSTAIGTLGLKLFKGVFAPSSEAPPVYPNSLAYGLLPALWGTFLVVSISILIAFPVSMAFAVLSNDFSIGWINTMIRGIMGFLYGIPGEGASVGKFTSP